MQISFAFALCPLLFFELSLRGTAPCWPLCAVMDAAQLAERLSSDVPEDRAAAYAALEATGDVALAVACVAPLAALLGRPAEEIKAAQHDLEALRAEGLVTDLDEDGLPLVSTDKKAMASKLFSMPSLMQLEIGKNKEGYWNGENQVEQAKLMQRVMSIKCAPQPEATTGRAQRSRRSRFDLASISCRPDNGYRRHARADTRAPRARVVRAATRADGGVHTHRRVPRLLRFPQAAVAVPLASPALVPRVAAVAAAAARLRPASFVNDDNADAAACERTAAAAAAACAHAARSGKRERRTEREGCSQLRRRRQSRRQSHSQPRRQPHRQPRREPGRLAGTPRWPARPCAHVRPPLSTARPLGFSSLCLLAGLSTCLL